MKKRYEVVIHYAGAYNFQIKAHTPEEAKQKANDLFEDVDDRELVANIGDIHVCDCWEVER